MRVKRLVVMSAAILVPGEMLAVQLVVHQEVEARGVAAVVFRLDLLGCRSAKGTWDIKLEGVVGGEVLHHNHRRTIQGIVCGTGLCRPTTHGQDLATTSKEVCRNRCGEREEWEVACGDRASLKCR